MRRSDNLVNLNDRSEDEAREIRAAGGRAAAKAKARNNKLRKRLECMMNQPSGRKKYNVFSDFMTGRKSDIETDGTYYDYMVASLADKAIKGDMKAISIVLDVLDDCD